MRPEKPEPLNGKRRIKLLPLPDPPPSSRSAGCPTARATWGDVCSPARRISFFDESGCLYET